MLTTKTLMTPLQIKNPGKYTAFKMWSATSNVRSTTHTRGQVLISSDS